MRNCGKHFPGHGFVKADSHTEVPVDRRSLAAILADDARPYEWLRRLALERDAGARGLSRRSTPTRPASRRAG